MTRVATVQRSAAAQRFSPTPSREGIVVSCNTITKSFGDGVARKTVVDEVSLDLMAGELTLLMGPSGSGKSTLLALLSGLLRPDSGDVVALGEHLWQLNDQDRERFRLAHCGFIFQGFNLFSALTAQEQVELILQYCGFQQRVVTSHANMALAEVGLTDRAHVRPQELSGGEKQRVAIARAIAKQPVLLFADEPTSALDKANGEIIVSLLRRAAEEHDACVFCVTHDPRLMAYGNRILQIEDGRIVNDERVRACRE
jgi:putative ABC transport system ATP-binding protein